MTTVANTVTDPLGVAVPRAKVTIELIAGDDTDAGYLDGETIVTSRLLYSDDDGDWSADLISNSSISPSGTYYRISEQPPGQTAKVHFIQVPATGGPYSLLETLVTDPETPDGNVGITQAAAEALITAQAIPKTLVDAKGDLIVATAADTPGRLAVGATNGHVLTVDSTTATGLKWAAVAGGAGAVDSVNGETGAVTLDAADVGAQPVDADLTAIAALSPSNDDLIQRKAGAWTNRTPAQVKTDLALTKSDVGLGSVTNTSDADKPVSTATATALAAKADLVGGVIPTAQLPALAVTSYLGSVASQAAMLALTGQEGDWAVRSDLGTVWFITGSDPTQLASWTQLAYPTAPVLSVNTQTGAVTLAASDVGAVPTARTVSTTAPLSGGGDLSANRTLEIAVGTAADTVAAGNDSRITGAQQRSALTAKGDIYVATASGVVTRLPVGSNDQVLTADSAQATGLKWADPAAGSGGLQYSDSGFISAGANGTDGFMTSAAGVNLGATRTVNASAGDLLELVVCGLKNNGGNSARIDAATVVSAARNRYFSSGTGTERAGGYGSGYLTSGQFIGFSVTIYHTVQADDISGGQVTVQPVGFSDSGDDVIRMNDVFIGRSVLKNLDA